MLREASLREANSVTGILASYNLYFIISYNKMIIFVGIIVICFLVYILWQRFKMQCTPIREGEEVATAITFGGGGTRSIAFYSASISSALRTANKKSKSGRIHLNDFMNKYDVIGCNSGGSWFMSLMVYSEQFYGMIDRVGGGDDIFGDCDNLTPINTSLFDSCSDIEGGRACMYGEKFNCCCNHGYKPNTSKKRCVKCSDSGQFTLTQYLMNCISNSRDLVDLYKDGGGGSLDEDIPEVLEEMAQEILGVSIYNILKVAAGRLTYNDIIRYIIFNSVDDIGSGSKIDSSPNGFTNVVSWSTSMMNNAYTTNANDGYTVEYNLKERDYDDYGISTPVRVMYDFSKNEGGDSLFHNNKKYTVLYKSEKFNVSGVIGDRPISPEKTDVRDLCTSSSSAAAFFASPRALDDVLKIVLPLIEYREDRFLCMLGVPTVRCSTSSVLSSRYSVFGPTLVDSSLYCDENDNELCTNWKPETDDIKSEYKKSVPVRMSDGFYGGDDTGIASSLSELQRKRPNVKRIKLVSFLNNGYSNPEFLNDSSLSKGFYKHFGVTSMCIPEFGDTNNKVNASVPGVPFLEMYTGNNQLFESEGCARQRRIFNGRYDDPEKWENSHNCDPITQFCSASVDVIAWNGLTTVKNSTFGIKPGYVVDLFVVNMRVGFWGAPSFPSPIDYDMDPGSTRFVNNLGDHSLRISKIMENLPSKVYDVVFGDTPYCPADLEERDGTPVNYYKNN
jgi:hypothetical protein